jgi:methyl-accepting chemotaxis protein
MVAEINKREQSLAARGLENQRRSEELAALFQVGTTLVSTLDLQEVLDIFCREAVKLMNATSAYACEWDKEQQTVTVVAEHYGPEASSRERVSDLGVSYHESTRIIESMGLDRPLATRLSDPDLCDEEREELEKYDGKSTLCLPLTARGHIFGYLEVWESRYDRPFTEGEILLGQNLVSQAGIAVENARLIQAMRQTVGDLGSAAAEILAATTQQASGANEQSAAIAQTTTTVDEVKAIAEQSMARAQEVAGVSRHTVDVSRDGRQAVEQTITSMRQIRTRVEEIAENILVLSEQMLQIGEIIATVNDISAQSNILALNASVEAARAGEHGKGFAVVAVEVRNLAEQSRQATAQVRTILSEIQKATNTTVMVTEEGTKGVEEGVRLAAQAGQAIERLAEVIEESAQAAAQMLAGGRQQVAGVEQVAVAMQNINQTTVQSLSSAHQTEKAARDLNDLAQRLSGTVEQYQSQSG